MKCASSPMSLRQHLLVTAGLLSLALGASACGRSGFVEDCVRAHESERDEVGLDQQSLENLCKAEEERDNSASGSKFPTGVTSSDIEESIVGRARSQFGVNPQSVRCDDSAQVEVGESIKCTIRLKDGRSADLRAQLDGIHPQRVTVK